MAPHVAQALQYYVAFQSNPTSLIQHLIRANNLTAEQLGLVEDKYVDPTIKGLRSDLEQTRRELASLKQGTSQQTVSTLTAQVNAFKDSRDEQGGLKYPYFERVRTLMAPIVDTGKSLDEAYQEVVWSVPEYRESQEKASREKTSKEAAEKAEKDRASKVKKAKDATTLPASDADKGKGKGEFKNWHDALREELQQMQ